MIQDYVKRNIKRFKEDRTYSPNDKQRKEEPLILSSIHNDGLSLDHKIKDLIKTKFEGIEQKLKSKEDRLAMMEVNLNRQEKKFNDTVTAISDATHQEFEKV